MRNLCQRAGEVSSWPKSLDSRKRSAAVPGCSNFPIATDKTYCIGLMVHVAASEDGGAPDDFCLFERESLGN